MQQPNLNYYTIIPDSVLKDTTLTDTDFKTLVVIYSLTRIDGFCSMSNGELSKLLGGIKENSLQKRISRLIGKKFLIRKLEEFHWGTLRKLYMPDKFFADAHQNTTQPKKKHSPTPTTQVKDKTYKNDFIEFVKYVRALPFNLDFQSEELEGVPYKYRVKGQLIVDDTDGRVLTKEESHSLWKWLNSNAVKPKVLQILDGELLKRKGL